MSLLKKIGNAVTKAVSKVGNVVNNVGKKLSTSNNMLLSGIGNVVDAIIPDEQKAAMATAAARDGEVKVEKVEQTIKKAAVQQGVTDPVVIKEVVHATATTIADETATTINDKGAETKATFKEKAIAFCKKYWKWLVGGGVALVALVVGLVVRKNKRGYRRRR